jgi:protein SCO1/2
MFRALRWTLLAIGAVVIALAFWARGREAPPEPPPVLSSLPDFELTSQGGEAVSLGSLRGRPWIADLVFTRCPYTCPRMTEVLHALGPGLSAAGGARRVSISVDPEHDTPAVLADYAERRGIQDPEWLFLTGDRGEVQRLAHGGFLLPFEEAPDEGAEELMLHSTRFVLVDAEARVRGYYDPFEAGATDRLLRDLEALHRGS